MPVYNLVLSTTFDAAQPFGNLITPISTSNLANVKWLVNWEGLFGANLLRYRKCILRYRLVSESNTNMTHNTNLGFLVATGISTDKQPGNFPGTFLGLVSPSTAIRSLYFYELSSLDAQHGIEINMPSSTSEFGLVFYRDNEFVPIGSYMEDYMVQLQFELLDKI